MKLLCINDTKGKGSEYFKNWIKEGEIYTVRRTEGDRVLLNEIKNPPIHVTELFGKFEPGFNIKRFIVLEDDNNIQEHQRHYSTAVS